MEPIPIDIKIEIYLHSKTNSWSDTAKFFDVSYSSVVRIANDNSYNSYKLKPITFYPLPINEPHVCSVFGCGRKLSAQEQLYGSKCIHHSKTIII